MVIFVIIEYKTINGYSLILQRLSSATSVLLLSEINCVCFFEFWSKTLCWVVSERLFVYFLRNALLLLWPLANGGRLLCEVYACICFSVLSFGQFEYSDADADRQIFNWPKPIDLRICVPLKSKSLAWQTTCLLLSSFSEEPSKFKMISDGLNRRLRSMEILTQSIHLIINKY